MSVLQNGMPTFLTGDKVVAFADNKKVSQAFKGYMDYSTLSTWYEEDPMNNHLGLVKMFGDISKDQYGLGMGLLPSLLQKKQVYEVGANRKFTYDVAVYEEYKCETVRDMSDQVYPGIDGGRFKIVLSEYFPSGVVLTYDVYGGEQIIVTEDGSGIQVAEGFEHIVELVSNDAEAWFPASQLDAGISYIKVSHNLLGELATNYDTFKMPDTSSKITLEYELGNETGVEAWLTSKADRAFSGGAVSASTMEYMNSIEAQIEKMGNTMMIMDVNQKTGKFDKNSARFAPTMEYFVRMELEKNTQSQLMWQKSGRFKDGNGDVVINEGLWWQMRRGRIIKYPRPGAMTKAHIEDAVEYLFRNNPLPIEDRKVVFEVGTQAHKNFMTIFSAEVNAQMDSISSFAPYMFGDDGQLPKKPISGDLKNLKLEMVRFTEVSLPGIAGSVSVKHNTSLDHFGGINADRFSSGSHPYGHSHTSYSAVIFDVTDQMYSNNKVTPQGTTLVEGGNDNANVYLIKPKGELVYSGSTNGRYDPYKYSDIKSATRERSYSYWAWSQCSIFVPDPSKFVMIELDPAARSGINN